MSWRVLQWSKCWWASMNCYPDCTCSGTWRLSVIILDNSWRSFCPAAYSFVIACRMESEIDQASWQIVTANQHNLMFVCCRLESWGVDDDPGIWLVLLRCCWYIKLFGGKSLALLGWEDAGILQYITHGIDYLQWWLAWMIDILTFMYETK